MGGKAMNQPDITKAKNTDLRASAAAIRRAAELARNTAIQTNTNLIVMKDGKLVRIPAQVLRKTTVNAVKDHS
jgi:hypothetical protein